MELCIWSMCLGSSRFQLLGHIRSLGHGAARISCIYSVVLVETYSTVSTSVRACVHHMAVSVYYTNAITALSILSSLVQKPSQHKGVFFLLPCWAQGAFRSYTQSTSSLSLSVQSEPRRGWYLLLKWSVKEIVFSRWSKKISFRIFFPPYYYCCYISCCWTSVKQVLFFLSFSLALQFSSMEWISEK